MIPTRDVTLRPKVKTALRINCKHIWAFLACAAGWAILIEIYFRRVP